MICLLLEKSDSYLKCYVFSVLLYLLYRVIAWTIIELALKIIETFEM